jgi:4-amino-4-deoxychorismate lyase
MPAGIKHSNYLNSILASMEAAAAGADDALMLSVSGDLAECSTANIFVVRGSEIMTPSPETGLLPGITRTVVFELASVQEGILQPDILRTTSELFVTNSVVGILPVRRVDSMHFPVDGIQTSRLRRAYNRLVNGA